MKTAIGVVGVVTATLMFVVIVFVTIAYNNVAQDREAILQNAELMRVDMCNVLVKWEQGVELVNLIFPEQSVREARASIQDFRSVYRCMN